MTAGGGGGVSTARRTRSLRAVVGGIAVWLRPYRRDGWLVMLLLLLDAGFTAALPLGLKFLVDYAIGPRQWTAVLMILGILATGTILASLAAVRRDWIYVKVGTRVLNDIRLRLFDHLQSLSPEYHARTQAGDIVARFSTDLAAVDSVVTTVLPWAMMSVLGILCSLAVLFFLQWELALGTLLAAPLLLIGPRILAPRTAEAGYRMKAEEAGVAGAVTEYLHGHAIVRLFGLQGAERAAFGARLERVGREGRRFGFLSGLVQRLPNLAVALIHVGVLAAAAVMAFRGTITVGALVSFDLVFVNFAGSIASLTEIAPSFLRAAAGMERIEELLREAPLVVDPVDPEPLPDGPGDIAFHDVSFSYVPGRPTLDRLTFTIPAGTTAAFVGRSGSGKSSVLGLLLRFHDPDSGAVTFGGRDLRHMRQTELRQRMAAVLQDAFLFDTTLRENIRAGRLSATDAEVEAAGRAVDVHLFAESLPLGWDSPVGGGGSRLSGGQRQRVAIARALLRDPTILLLDEATSALDSATETAVERRLEAASVGRTVITVTHRLSAAVRAHRIFVLDAGRLVEDGTHDELLHRGGAYASFWRKQQGFSVSADGAEVTVDPDRLREIPILAEVDTALLGEIAQRFAVERVPENRTVIVQGDPGDRFYLIARGRVAVAVRTATGEKERVVATLETGDYFGEVALLRGVPRTASVRTLAPSLLLSLSRNQFLELVERAPGLRERLEAILTAREGAASR